MDVWKLLEDRHDLSGFPVGVSACRFSDICSDSCGHDIVVFDGRPGQTDVVESDNEFFIINHASLHETDPKRLLQYDGMNIIHDESWDLRMFLSKIATRRQSLLTDLTKNSLIDSLFCCQKTIDLIRDSDVFAPCWQKCASYCLADAICSLNGKAPNPVHMLDLLRKSDESLYTNEHVSVATQTVGIERATSILLERVLKSTVGLAGLVGGTDSSHAIRYRHDLLINNSMFSDCYFYLGYTNKENFMKIQDLTRRPDLIYILKIAFDVDADLCLLSRRADLIRRSCNTLLDVIALRE